MRPSLPPLGRLLPGVFYGWVIVAGSLLLSFVTVGVGFYSLPVLLDGLVQVHGWSPASVSGATSLYFFVTAVTASLVGRGVDRFGVRWFILAGVSCMALALVGIGRVRSPAELYLLYPLMAVGFALCAGVPNQALIARWFLNRRALAMSISQTGVSLGGIVLVPLATGLIEGSGLSAATDRLAILIVLVALPVTGFVLRSDPARYGLLPDGKAPGVNGNPQLHADVQGRVWTTREALGSSSFWILAGVFGSVLFCQQGMSIHLISFLREPIGAGRAALAVSTMAGGSAVARLVVGSFADRVEKRRVAQILIAIQAGAYVVFSLASGPAAYFFGALALGSTIGNLYMLQSLLVAELFGVASFGTVLGMLMLMTQVLGGLGPYGLGLLRDGFGAYAPAIRILAVIAIGSALLLSRLRPPARADAAV